MDWITKSKGKSKLKDKSEIIKNVHRESDIKYEQELEIWRIR